MYTAYPVKRCPVSLILIYIYSVHLITHSLKTESMDTINNPCKHNLNSHQASLHWRLLLSIRTPSIYRTHPAVHSHKQIETPSREAYPSRSIYLIFKSGSSRWNINQRPPPRAYGGDLVKISSKKIRFPVCEPSKSRLQMVKRVSKSLPLPCFVECPLFRRVSKWPLPRAARDSTSATLGSVLTPPLSK